MNFAIWAIVANQFRPHLSVHCASVAYANVCSSDFIKIWMRKTEILIIFDDEYDSEMEHTLEILEIQFKTYH